MKDFASNTSFFSGDAIADDDSPLDEVLFDFFDLFVLAGDGFKGIVAVGGLRWFFVGDFLTVATFDGETFWFLFCVLTKNKTEKWHFHDTTSETETIYVINYEST